MVPKIKMAFLVVLACLCFFTPTHQSPPPNAAILELSYENTDFAMNLYRKLANYNDKNIFFSPLSVSTTFASLLMASGGITREEILRGLDLNQLETNQTEHIPKLFQLLQENIAQNGSLKLEQSMALFISQQFEVKKTFEDRLKTFFQADIRTVDFAESTKSITLINEYIKQKTGGKIVKMISTLDETTRLLLINSIYFQGAWKNPFNPNLTESAAFHIDNYNVVQVSMMIKEERFFVTEDVLLGARVLKLPYQDGVSMLILLPNKNVDYTSIDEEISAEKFSSWIEGLRKTKLEVHVPKFKMEQAYALQNILPDMGMTSLFSTSANLTGISEGQDLMVSEVLHKAVIEVDETGTTAAAATTVGITPYSLPRMFIVDRPFFFFIYHEETKSLLFMGRVIDPTKN
nr:protein Z-dependent protease inhibitor [Nothobranchius furzeri]XP_015825580.2 protein Z-dependent protease inhibitor [Nothobranchius furzeri]XP_054597572.1 protein Z-dependent protease inhibitor [Nothobranchius furzeri]